MYEDRVVLFVDVLGFKEAVDELDRHPEHIGKMVDLFNKVPGSFEKVDETSRKTSGLQVSNFSDCIAVTSFATDENALRMVRTAQLLGARLLLAGYLNRGAISVGRVYHQGSTLIGRGIINAYLLESRVAKYPRIVIDPAFLTRFARLELSDTVAPADTDGLRYANIFDRKLFESSKGWFEEGFTFRALMTVMGNELIEKLKQFGSKLDPTTSEKKSKTLWLVNYFNRVVLSYDDTKMLVIK